MDEKRWMHNLLTVPYHVHKCYISAITRSMVHSMILFEKQVSHVFRVMGCEKPEHINIKPEDKEQSADLNAVNFVKSW